MKQWAAMAIKKTDTKQKFFSTRVHGFFRPSQLFLFPNTFRTFRSNYGFLFFFLVLQL